MGEGRGYSVKAIIHHRRRHLRPLRPSSSSPPEQLQRPHLTDTQRVFKLKLLFLFKIKPQDSELKKVKIIILIFQDL